MKIPPEDFRWYAAFHDEGNHPHVHMMAWSVKPNQTYLSKDGIRQIKSTLTNQIFHQELLHVYEQKSKSRDELVAEARKAMQEKKRLRPPLSQQKEFRQIKNAVIKEAEHIRMNRISFEDEEMQDDGEQISAYTMSYACQDLQSVANDESFPLAEQDEAAEQLEQLANAGNAHAQYIIGTAYRDGGLLIPDMAKAKKFLERAAEQKIDAVQYAIGKLYLSDDADVHDPAKGIYWLKCSADNGNDFAAYRLGKEYLSGINTIKDAETAVSYLRRRGITAMPTRNFS